MNRRQFIQCTTLASAVHTAGTVAADPAPPTAVAHEIKPSAYEEATVDELQSAMVSGKTTSASLAREYLQRIEELDQNGPRLRSVIETNPDALAIAGALDEERKKNGPRGPLHG